MKHILSDLCTSLKIEIHEFILVKYQKQSVCLNQCSVTKCTKTDKQ